LTSTQTAVQRASHKGDFTRLPGSQNIKKQMKELPTVVQNGEKRLLKRPVKVLFWFILVW